MPSYFDTDVFKTWLADAKPKYAETKLNLRHLVAELIGKFTIQLFWYFFFSLPLMRYLRQKKQMKLTLNPKK